MEYLTIVYFVIAGICATIQMKRLPDNVSMIRALFLGLMFPAEFILLGLKLMYRIFGFDLQVGLSRILSKQEQKEMTDAFMRNLSDELKKMQDNIRENDEK